MRRINHRKQLTIKEKYEIVKALERGAKQADLARAYHVSPATINVINKNRSKVLLEFGTLPRTTKKNRTTVYIELDSALLEWFTVQRNRSIPISGPILLEKANQLASSIQIPGFNCTSSWITRFRKRHSISCGTVSGESRSVDEITVETWLREVWPLTKAGYDEKDIFNGDETGLFYRMLPNKTLKFKNENCHGGKLSKERLTIYLCASMTGEKRRPLIIGKFKKPRCFKNQRFGNVAYQSNKNAWMTTVIFKEELLIWDSELRAVNRKILLLIDNFGSHAVDNDILTNIKLIFLPPNTTSKLQPLDAGIIKNFKVYYKKGLVIKLIQSLDDGQQFNITVLEAMRLAETSWSNVTASTIVNSFNKVLNPNLEQRIEGSTFFGLEDIIPFFETERAFNEYIDADIMLETYGDEQENENIEFIPNEAELIKCLKEEDELEITEHEAIKSLIVVKKYYQNTETSRSSYEHILMIEKELEAYYLKKKMRQRKITEYLFKK